MSRNCTRGMFQKCTPWNTFRTLHLNTCQMFRKCTPWTTPRTLTSIIREHAHIHAHEVYTWTLIRYFYQRILSSTIHESPHPPLYIEKYSLPPFLLQHPILSPRILENAYGGLKTSYFVWDFSAS